MSELLLRVRGLQVEFDGHAAVRGLSFDLHSAETLGLVGESGSGKSTLARAILRLVGTSGGSVQWRGEELLTCAPKRLRALRRDMQMIFQNPLASLNPRMRIAEAIAEPLDIFEPALPAKARAARVEAMLERVGLNADMGGRYPHEFSGGQCQRIGIARAMILNPKLLVCDEPVSSLDVSIQGQIVNLLADLQSECGTAMFFISHNLAVVRHLSRRIMVIYMGRCIESAARDELFAKPLHPYSAALLAAAAEPMAAPPSRAGPPGADSAAVESVGPPSVGPPSVGPPSVGPPSVGPPSVGPPGVGGPAVGRAFGCAYLERCGYAIAICRTTEPPLAEVSPGHLAACHRAREFCERGHETYSDRLLRLS
jgi:oligopeptide transport system ATP-binding protein